MYFMYISYKHILQGIYCSGGLQMWSSGQQQHYQLGTY